MLLEVLSWNLVLSRIISCSISLLFLDKPWGKTVLHVKLGRDTSDSREGCYVSDPSYSEENFQKLLICIIAKLVVKVGFESSLCSVMNPT